MPPAPTCQFSLRVEAVDGDLGGPGAVEELALDLRTELIDAPVTRIDQVPTGAAPDDARGIELLHTAEFMMTAVQTVATLLDVIEAIRRSAARYAQRRQRVKLTVAGVELDPVDATDGEVRQLVDTLLELPADAAAGVRSALVVANAGYDDPRLAQLRSPGHDADALVRVLGDPAIGGFDVDLLMDADERTIRRRIAAFFADRDRDDVLVLHFSCHGVKDARGRLYLAARDTDLSVLGATGIPAAFINDLLSETQSRRVVLILDCCYSGAFARGSQVRAGNEVLIADEFGAGSGRIVLTASSATEYAFEGGELASSSAQPSAFTSALVGGLETGEADLDADGEISIDELYDYTYRAVRETTPGQAPMKWSFGVEGSLVVARSVRPATLPPWIHEDLLSDRVVLRLEAVRALEKIVRGGKPGLRAAALGTLAQLRDHDDSVRVQRAAATALGAAGAGTAAAPAAGPGAVAAAPPMPKVPPVPAPPAAAPPPTPPAAVPTATRSEPAPPPPSLGEPSTEVAAPAGELPTETGHRGGLLPIVGGVLVLLSLLLYVIGAVSTEAHWWTTSWAWIPELVAVTLLLSTRQPLWTGFLAGLLSWEWLYTSVIWLGDTNIRYASGVYGAGNLAALAALICLVIAILRERRPFHDAGRKRIAATAVIAVLSVGTGLLVAGLLRELLDLDGGTARSTLLVGMALGAAVVPLVGLAAPGSPAARLAPVGWLIGATQFAIIETVELHNYDHTAELTWTWILLAATTATAFAANARLPVNLAARPRDQRTVAQPSDWRALLGTPGGVLWAASGSLTLLSLLLYVVAVATGKQYLWDALVDDDWASSHGVAWIAELIVVVLLLATGKVKWAGALIGLLSWEWLYFAIMTKSELHDYLRKWVFYFAGNLAALTALGCAIAAMIVTRQPARGPLWTRLVGTTVVALLALGASLIATWLLFNVVFSDGLGTSGVIVALLCAAVLPVACLAAPTSSFTPYVPLGWLIGGAQYALNETQVFYGNNNETEIILLWALLVLTTAAFLGTTQAHRLSRNLFTRGEA